MTRDNPSGRGGRRERRQLGAMLDQQCGHRLARRPAIRGTIPDGELQRRPSFPPPEIRLRLLVLQPLMIEESPDVYFYPRYVGAGGWVGILLDQIADDALESHLREARRIIASKRKPARKPRGM
jgi:hypothetical protein